MHGIRPAVIAHRGASGHRPEHTRAAYALALAQGADALEPDLVATADGVLVIRHENEIGATTDVAAHPEFAARRTTRRIDGVPRTGWFTEDFTWAELATLRARERLPELRPDNARYDGREPLLRLRDLLALVGEDALARGRRAGLVIELKHATHFAGRGLPLDELLAAELADTGLAAAPDIVVESFEPGVLARLPDLGVRCPRVVLHERLGAPYDRVAADGVRARGYRHDRTPGGLRRLAASGLAGVSVPLRLAVASRHGDPAPTGLIERIHEAGLAAYCWTLRPENTFLPSALRRGRDPAVRGHWRRWYRAVLASGADAVFADHPDLALAVRDGDGDVGTGTYDGSRNGWE